MPTGIEWTDATWNPVTGCTKVSPGCDHCYAERVTDRFKRHPFTEVTLHPGRLEQPLKWKEPRRIFVCSMGDLFHSAVPWEFIEQVFITMVNCPQHTFQVLTKRPGRLAWWINERWLPTWAAVTRRLPPNIWVGTSVESQKYARRLDVLARVPAKVRFVSYEPALGPVDFGLDLVEVGPEWPSDQEVFLHDRECGNYCDYACGGKWILGLPISWVIAGGESGPGARPAHPDWFRSARDQCQTAAVPFFFKQWGDWIPFNQIQVGPQMANFNGRKTVQHDYLDGHYLVRLGKKATGAPLDGREWREMPDG